MTRCNDISPLQTDRLTLRLPCASDLPTYRAFYAVTDLQVGKYRAGRSAPEVAAILDADMAHWQSHGFGMFLLCQKDRVLGGTGLATAKGWPGHELTWWLMPDARGQGFATEASRRVINWAHDDLGWDRVETYMRDENAPARRMATRLGGRVVRRTTFPDGVTRDVFLLSEQRRGAA